MLLTWQANRLTPYLIVVPENRRRCAKPLDFQGVASATPMEEQRLFFLLTLAGLIVIGTHAGFRAINRGRMLWGMHSLQMYW